MAEIIDLKNNILSKLEQARHILSKTSELGLSNTAKQIYAGYAYEVERQKEFVSNLELKMAIVAPMSAGKSTIINAIVSQELLPVSATAMTSICTEIVFNSELSEPTLNIAPEFIDFFHDLTRDLQRKIELIGEDRINQLMGSHPHLEELKKQIHNDHQRILENINQTQIGIDNIEQTLYYINHVVRLANIIDKSNEHNLMNNLKNLPLPRINTSYTQNYLSQHYQNIGNLIIIDTPGPSESDMSQIWDVLIPILKSCSAILVVLDFTQLNNEAAEKVKIRVQELNRLMRENNLYVLVNKIDQRTPNSSMTSEHIESLVYNEFGVKKQENIEKVFEVSGRQAFFAAKYLHERQSNPNLQKTELKTVHELASQVFAPISWEEDLADCTLSALDKKAVLLWKKSGFNSFLEQVIHLLLAKAAPIAFRGALNNAHARILDAKTNYYDVFLSINEIDKERIIDGIKSLEEDMELVKMRKEAWQVKVMEILETNLMCNINNITNDLESAKNSLDNEIEKIINKILKQNRFDSRTELDNVFLQVSQNVQEHIDQTLKPTLERIEYLLKDVNERLKKATNEILNPTEISQIVQKRLSRDLDVNITFDFDNFVPSITIDNTKLKIDDIKVYVSFFGYLHNTFTRRLKILNANIPVVNNKYKIGDRKIYIQQVKDTIQEGIDSLTREFKKITQEMIPGEAEKYAQQLQKQILIFQRNMEDIINFKSQEARDCELRKREFSFLSQMANELLTEIDTLRQENEKLL